MVPERVDVRLGKTGELFVFRKGRDTMCRPLCFGERYPMLFTIALDVLDGTAQKWLNGSPFRFVEHRYIHLAAPAPLGDRHSSLTFAVCRAVLSAERRRIGVGQQRAVRRRCSHYLLLFLRLPAVS